jgi:hypothetical protein
MGEQMHPQSKKRIHQVTQRHIPADLLFYPQQGISSSCENFAIYIATSKNMV